MTDYIDTAWVDELLAGAERFDIRDNAGVAIHLNSQITLATGVTVLGTSVAAAVMNNMEAAIKALMNGGWIADGTWTYLSASSFKVPTDLTAIFTAGRLLKWTQTTVKFGVVVSSSYSAPDTTVVIAVNTSYVMTNAAISLAFYSWSIPLGWPNGLPSTPFGTLHAIKDKCFLGWVDASTISVGIGALTINGIQYARSAAFNITFAQIDTGAEAAGKNYYVYAVPGTTAGQFDAIISLSATAPTGYANFRLIGWFHNNPSSAISRYSIGSARSDADVDYPEKGPKPGMLQFPGSSWMIDVYIASDSGGTGKAIHAGNAAASAYNATPWVSTTYFAQYKACMNAGKRLCSNEEWSMAVFGTPPGADNNNNCWTAAANTGSHATGTLANCVSTLGAYDMVGNVNERVATWSMVTDVAADQNGWGYTTEASTWTGEAEGGEAYTAFGANAAPDAHQGPRALIRGGYWSDSVHAGGWFVGGNSSPRGVSANIGFRCCS